MNSLNSFNTPLEGGVEVPTHSLRGVLELSNTPLKGGVGQLEHPPVGGVVPQKSRYAQLVQLY